MQTIASHWKTVPTRKPVVTVRPALLMSFFKCSWARDCRMTECPAMSCEAPILHATAEAHLLDKSS